MPIGTHHIQSGLLLREGSQLVLQIDGGGRWRLDAPRRAEKLLGRRVTVDARRDGFDLLGVNEIWPDGEPRPARMARAATFELAAALALPLVLIAIVLLAG